jgi:hypothetical protein
MVAPENFFSKAQWPKNLQNGSQPTHKASFVIPPIATPSPVSNASKRLAEKGQHKLRAVHPVRPTTECGRIGYAIRVLKHRRRFFPGAVFYKSAPQRITTRQQAVVRIGERKQWQKSEGLPATGAATATDPNPIMMLIVRLLAAASVADDRLSLTYRTSPQDLVAVLVPLSFKLVRRRRKWDKENRSRWGSATDVDLPRSEPEAELLLLKIQSPQENKAFRLQVL